MTITKHLTITLPTGSITPSLPSTTHLPSTHRTFSAPRSPYPWVWRCHKCRTVFRFSAALNRCLQCSHRFCTKCVSEFDYSGWEHWKSYWRPESSPDPVEKDDDDEVRVVEDIYRGEREREQEELLWSGFEVVNCEVGKRLNLYMNIDEDDGDSTPPTSPSSEGSDELDLWEMTQNNLQRAESFTTTTDTNPPHEALDVSRRITYGEECEVMRDLPLPPAPNSTPESGYRSVQEARKALYPSDEGNGYYGAGEEGETMRDWSGFFSPDDVWKSFYICRGIDETANCGKGSREEDQRERDEPLWSPRVMSPVAFEKGFF